MRVQSIWTAIEPRNPAGDGLFLAPIQMALRKVHCVAEFHHVVKKVGPVTEALQNPRHLLPTGFLTPLVIDCGHVASSIGIFNQLDFGLFVIHGANLAISWIYHDNNFRNTDFPVDNT
jgi:hypothetical protein